MLTQKYLFSTGSYRSGGFPFFVFRQEIADCRIGSYHSRHALIVQYTLFIATSNFLSKPKYLWQFVQFKLQMSILIHRDTLQQMLI